MKEYSWTYGSLFLSIPLSAVPPKRSALFFSTIFYPRELMEHTTSITQLICEIDTKNSPNRCLELQHCKIGIKNVDFSTNYIFFPGKVTEHHFLKGRVVIFDTQNNFYLYISIVLSPLICRNFLQFLSLHMTRFHLFHLSWSSAFFFTLVLLDIT